MPKNLLKVALDYDDVLGICNGYAIDIVNQKRGKKEFDVNNIKGFNYEDGSLSERQKLYRDPEFIRTMPLYPGVKEFIHELSKKAEVFITSAAFPECMSARALRIVEDFPEIKPQNIILGASKSLYNIDVLLDDSSHNILSSRATYPVLMRRPWNEDLSGNLVVSNYDDFLHLIDVIRNGTEENPDVTNGGVICLIGPSGSGKTAIAEVLSKDKTFTKPIATTTRLKMDSESKRAYHFVSEKKFLKDIEAGKFLESTVYSGSHYGTSAKEIDTIVADGKIAVLPVDICGGITIKNLYKNKAMLIFIDRSKQDVILQILARDCSDEQKMRRIVSLDNEYKNESFCDYTIHNDGTIEDAVEQVKKII